MHHLDLMIWFIIICIYSRYACEMRYPALKVQFYRQKYWMLRIKNWKKGAIFLKCRTYGFIINKELKIYNKSLNPVGFTTKNENKKINVD